MKRIYKTITLLALLAIFSTSAFAQANFEKGSKVAQLGFALGSSVGLPISAAFEYGITDKIGVGLTAGFSSKDFGFYQATYIPVGLKGNYHFYQTDKIDAYGGVVVGYLVASVSGTTLPVASLSTVMYGGLAGARYYFTPQIAAFGEVGYTSLGFLTLGVAYKL